jgi:ABC-type branched-subunit amino acid transport system substrate-binding protein
MPSFNGWGLLAAAAASAFSAGSMAAEPDPIRPTVECQSVVLGMSAALSGPTSNLGIGMRTGIEAATEEANRGPAHPARQFKLIPLDDGYEPAKTGPNMRRLIDEEHAAVIIGNVGTPTAVAAIPIVNETHVPLVGCFTGAGHLRKNPPDRYVINYRASYVEETGAMVDALVTIAGLKPTEIGFFTQRDAFGDAGFAGGLAALKRHGLRDASLVSQGRFERNTTNVEAGLAELIAAKTPVRAVIMVGTAAPCAEFVKAARRAGLNAMFLNVSFVDANKLAEMLGADGDGVIVTQVVPHFDSTLPIVQEYRRALAALATRPSPNFVSLEGYIAARMLLRAIAKINGPVTSDAITDALERLGEFDLGLGEPLRLSPQEHQASHRVWATKLVRGKVVSFEWEELRPRD